MALGSLVGHGGKGGSIKIHFRPFVYLVEKMSAQRWQKVRSRGLLLIVDSLPLAKLFSCIPDWPSFPLCKK